MNTSKAQQRYASGARRTIARKCQEQAKTGARLLMLGVTLLIVQAIASAILAFTLGSGS